MVQNDILLNGCQGPITCKNIYKLNKAISGLTGDKEEKLRKALGHIGFSTVISSNPILNDVRYWKLVTLVRSGGASGVAVQIFIPQYEETNKNIGITASYRVDEKGSENLNRISESSCVIYSRGNIGIEEIEKLMEHFSESLNKQNTE